MPSALQPCYTMLVLLSLMPVAGASSTECRSAKIPFAVDDVTSLMQQTAGLSQHVVAVASATSGAATATNNTAAATSGGAPALGVDGDAGDATGGDGSGAGSSSCSGSVFTQAISRKNFWGYEHGTTDKTKDLCVQYTKKELGEGANGAVKEGHIVDTSGDQSTVAVKFATKVDKEKFSNEVDIMVHLLKVPDHLVVLRGFNLKDQSIAMEVLRGGDLWEQKKTTSSDGGPLGLSVNDAKKVMKQVVAAVKDCHDHHVAHRDLKEEQWVYKTPPNGDWGTTLKLLDFGEAVRVKSSPLRKLSGETGSAFWMSPELTQDLGDNSYVARLRKKNGVANPPDTFSVYAPDVWAVGVIAYQVVTGKYFVVELYEQVLGEKCTGDKLKAFLDHPANVFDVVAIAKETHIQKVLDATINHDPMKAFIKSALTIDVIKRPGMNDLATSLWLTSDDTP